MAAGSKPLNRPGISADSQRRVLLPEPEPGAALAFFSNVIAMADDDRRLVYSTDPNAKIGEVWPPPAGKRGPPESPRRSASLPDDGVVRVGCEKRRGGLVTLVYGLADRDLESTAQALKKRCGTGGTVKDGIVVIQGDKRAAALGYLRERGLRVKKMGG